jgi:glycosyltransferase involved in cell wall biosynthesis
MRLLMFTRKVDKEDSRANFVSDWLLTLAKNLDQLVVICQEKGDTAGLPKNIEIYSLGKEFGYSKIRQFFRAQKLLFKLIKKCDGVFAHQMPIYSVLAGPWCWLFHKKLIQWYTHKSIDWRLRLADIFVDAYVSASPESFRLKTKKPVHIFGHGININKFQPRALAATASANYKLLTIGRISPSKDYESMIKAVYELKEQGVNNLSLTIIGAPAMADGFNYSQILQDMVTKMNLSAQVEFLGGLSQTEIIPHLQNADLFINLSDTGSLDKAVLEAMATGCLVLTSNTAFKSILPSELFTPKDNPGLLADKIKKLLDLDETKKVELKKKLRQEIIEHHNLGELAEKITALFLSTKSQIPASPAGRQSTK